MLSRRFHYLTSGDRLRAIADEVERHPERWAKGMFAFDEQMIPVEPLSKRAICWCAEGFVRRDGGDSQSTNLMEYALYRTMPQFEATDWNVRPGMYNDLSTTTAGDVVTWFRKAADWTDGSFGRFERFVYKVLQWLNRQGARAPLK